MFRVLAVCTGLLCEDGKCTDELASVKAAMRFLKQTYGNTAAKDFEPLALEAVRHKMIEAGENYSKPPATLMRCPVEHTKFKANYGFSWEGSQPLPARHGGFC